MSGGLWELWLRAFAVEWGWFQVCRLLYSGEVLGLFVFC